MLVGVGSGVEISEQYGSNRGIFKFQIALKCPEMVRFARATHHSIRNIPKFPTHTRMLAYEVKIFFICKNRTPHWQLLDHGSLLSKCAEDVHGFDFKNEQMVPANANIRNGCAMK